MACKDCIHNDVCENLMTHLSYKPQLCSYFKDRSLICRAAV